MDSTIYLHADPDSTVTAETQTAEGYSYAVMHLHGPHLHLALLGPLPTESAATRLDFARSLVQTATQFLAIEEQHATQVMAL
ncbi:hypothetical protein [Streptacidiphilus carbonis]|uniref:hypothetical protein n=1 Tax=Streptacidiphilus carbonis TaxID=105422 RepID=UPI0005A6D370|nr:hypothetical protein [Streptacidiphilus carbonis]